MQELLLVRYGEIFLKGLNRPYFIRALVRKIRYAVRGMGAEVWVHDGRIFVKGFRDMEECIVRVTKVFGVHSVCPAVEMPKDDFEAICAQAVEMTERAPAGHYDVILMDIQMPRMDGYEAARRIRALEDPDKANIPIVAVTANAFDEDRREALEAGMDGHLAKPYDIPQMMDTLSRLLK